MPSQALKKKNSANANFQIKVDWKIALALRNMGRHRQIKAAVFTTAKKLHANSEFKQHAIVLQRRLLSP